jgi:hypothetical protein
MLLTEDYVNAYVHKLKSESGYKWTPFRYHIDFANVTGFARLNDTFIAADVDYKGDTFIVPQDVALDYWCNPTSGLCESGRSYSVEKEYNTSQSRAYTANYSAGFELASSNGDIGHLENNVVSNTYASNAALTNLLGTAYDCAQYQKGQTDQFVGFYNNSALVTSAYLCNASNANIFSQGIMDTQFVWVHYDDGLRWYQCGNNSAVPGNCTSCNNQTDDSESAAARSFAAPRLCQDLQPPNSSDFHFLGQHPPTLIQAPTPIALALQIEPAQAAQYSPAQYYGFVARCAA